MKHSEAVEIWDDQVRKCFWVVHVKNGIVKQTINDYKITNVDEATRLAKTTASMLNLAVAKEVKKV